jgi:hypothetical protein
LLGAGWLILKTEGHLQKEARPGAHLFPGYFGGVCQPVDPAGG